MSIVWKLNVLRFPHFSWPKMEQPKSDSSGLEMVAIELSDRAAARLNQSRIASEVTQMNEFLRAGGQITARR